MTIRKSPTRLYEDIAKLTLSGKATIASMNLLIFEMFKKKSVDKLTNDQLEQLLERMTEISK